MGAAELDVPTPGADLIAKRYHDIAQFIGADAEVDSFASVGINDVGLLTAPDGRTYAVAVMIRQTTRPPSARHAIMQNVVRAVIAQWQAGQALPAEGRQVAATPGAPNYARGF